MAKYFHNLLATSIDGPLPSMRAQLRRALGHDGKVGRAAMKSASCGTGWQNAQLRWVREAGFLSDLFGRVVTS